MDCNGHIQRKGAEARRRKEESMGIKGMRPLRKIFTTEITEKGGREGEEELKKFYPPSPPLFSPCPL